MPKADYLRRIDASQTARRTGQPTTAQAHASGNADTVDGLHASIVPRAWNLLALDENGRFPATAIPVASLSGNQATGHHGVQYFGPTTYLARKCAETDNVIYVTAPVIGQGQRIVVSDYRTPSEHMYVIGAGENVGGMWRYEVSRAKNDPRTQALTTAQTHAKGAQVVSLGGAGGGHIYVVSAADDSEPYIQVRDNNDDASGSSPFSTSWKTQFGNLSNIPQWFKDLFPAITNWERWGFAGEDVFTSGGIYAKYGSIAGDLDVTGLLTVKETVTGARLEFGDTVAGWGMAMRNSAGTPIWMLVSPYTDTSGNTSEVAWVVQSYGKKAIYHRYDEASGQWILTVGGFDITDDYIKRGNLKIGTTMESLSWYDNAVELYGSSSGDIIISSYTGGLLLRAAAYLDANGYLMTQQYVDAVQGYKTNGVAGYSGSFDPATVTTITVSGGIITGVA